LPDGALWAQFYRADTGYLLRFPGLADFASTGLEVTAWPAPGISGQTVEHLYLNQVLPLALSMQGKLVFHASAVEIGDGAIAFMGESGKGKSTLAASFATSGYRFLTDDGLIVEAGNDEPRSPTPRSGCAGQRGRADRPTPPPARAGFHRQIALGRRPHRVAIRPGLRWVYFLDGNAPSIGFQRLALADACSA
jgi:hypothetical protein